MQIKNPERKQKEKIQATFWITSSSQMIQRSKVMSEPQFNLKLVQHYQSFLCWKQSLGIGIFTTNSILFENMATVSSRFLSRTALWVAVKMNGTGFPLSAERKGGGTSAAPATFSCSIPFLSFSSIAEYWMDCTWLKLARCVGCKGATFEWERSAESVLHAAANTNTKTRCLMCCLLVFGTHSGSLVREVTDPFLWPDRQVDLDHPARLLQGRGGEESKCNTNCDQRGAG